MAEPTLIGDRIAPYWNSLTDEQKTEVIANIQSPALINAENEKIALNIWQQVVKQNSNTTVSNPARFCPSCKPAQKKLEPLPLFGQAWIRQSLLADGTTARYGVAIVTLFTPVADGTIATVVQGYGAKQIPNKRPPRVRHVRVLQPLDVGDFNLSEHDGYYATTAGNTKFARITGRNAARRPDQPLCAIKIVDTDTGVRIWQTVPNPYGGGDTHINRPRSSQFDTKPGDHYP